MAIEVFSQLSLAYQAFLTTLPFWLQNFLNLFLMVLTVVIYSIIIWFVYRFMARRDIFPIDYTRFHLPNRSAFNKTITGFLYFIKNIIVSPILIFFYYVIFTFILLSLTENINLDKIIFLAAIIVASIRATAYYREALSQDLAKLLPLTLLGVSLIEGSLNMGAVISSFSQIPSLFNKISIYFLFIIALEALLRLTDIFLIESGAEEGDEIKEK